MNSFSSCKKNSAAYLVPKILKKNVKGTKNCDFYLYGLKIKLWIFLKTIYLVNPIFNNGFLHEYIISTNFSNRTRDNNFIHHNF